MKRLLSFEFNMDTVCVELKFSVRKSHDHKSHFPNGNRRQQPPCLLYSETVGHCQWRRKPFILTIDGTRLIC